MKRIKARLTGMEAYTASQSPFPRPPPRAYGLATVRYHYAVQPGGMLGPYEILSLLGAGGMGAVYRARDTRLGREIALKVILPESNADPASHRRLLNEAKAASALNHPNAVTVYEAASVDGVDFIAMELIDGETLAQRIGHGQIPIQEAVFIALQVAEGLAAAHEAGLVHRDLKPSNIMIARDGRAKIVDFGLARRAPRASGGALDSMALTRSGMVAGTLAYMSPEQARGDDPGPPSDVFAYGAVLYEILCGVRAFDANSQLDLFHRICFEEPVSISKRRPGVPAPLAGIAEKALSKTVGKRPSAKELVAALRPLANRPATGRATKWVIAAATVLALAMGASFLLPKPGGVSALVLPRSASELVARGDLYMKRRDRAGNIERAVADFEAALEQDPSSAPALAGLTEARLAKNSESPDAALLNLAGESAKRALQLNPDLAKAHSCMGQYLTQTGKRPDGEAEFEVAEKLDPRNPQVQWRLGAAMDLLGNLDQAEKHFRRALELDPEDYEPYAQYAAFFFRRGRYSQAAEYLQKAYKLAPDNYVLSRNLGGCYLFLGRYDDAATILQRSLEARPMASTYTNFGSLYFMQGRYGEAASKFRKALDLDANDGRNWVNLGDAYRWSPGDKAKSLEAYQTAVNVIQAKLTRQPGDPELRAMLSKVFTLLGRTEQAMPILAALEKDAATRAADWFTMAVAYEAGGDLNAALVALEKSLAGGYPVDDVRNEPELLNLRRDPRFQRLLVKSTARRR